MNGMFMLVVRRYFFLLLCSILWLQAEQIKQYHVDVTLLQNGELKIIETIDYDFSPHQKHGINRDIYPYVWTWGHRFDLVLRDINVTQDAKVVVFGLESMPHYTPETRIHIGDKARRVEGSHRYVITYTIVHGIIFDPEDKTKDALYLNLIGTGWQVPIQKITGIFHLPLTLARKDIHLTTYSGSYSAKTTHAQIEWIDEHTLQVTHERLEPREGVTVRLTFASDVFHPGGDYYRQKVEEDRLAQAKEAAQNRAKKEAYDRAHLVKKGTYIREGDNLYLGNWLLDHLLLYVGLFFMYLYYAYTLMRGLPYARKSIPVQYYPPEGLSLLQSGLLLDKHADREDLAAAIMELAAVGYLSISDVEGMTHIQRQDKQIESLTVDQKYILEEILFLESDIFVLKQRKNEEATRLIKAIGKLSELLYGWALKKQYLQYHTRSRYTLFIMITAVIFTVGYGLLAYAILLTYGTTDIRVGVYFSVMMAVLGLMILVGLPRKYTRYAALPSLIVSLIAIGMIALLNLHNTLYSTEIVILFVSLVLLLVLLIFGLDKIGALSTEGIKLQQKLLGLKQFITRVDKERLEHLLREDPYYLEKILPYALLFGEVAHWMTHFEAHNISMPKWHGGVSIQHFSQSIVQISSSSVSTSSRSSGGSVSSGFSGGGMGGGGGGSW